MKIIVGGTPMWYGIYGPNGGALLANALSTGSFKIKSKGGKHMGLDKHS
jgi:hypothetical protein